MKKMKKDPKQLENIVLQYGSHTNPETGMCAMEAVAWLAGETHSDAPACTCPVLAAYVRSLNDNMDESNRQKLKQYIPQLIGTNNPKLETKRSHVLAWAAITEFAPFALEVNGLTKEANKLKSLSKYDWVKAKKIAREAAVENAADAAYWASRAAADAGATRASARASAWTARAAARAAEDVFTGDKEKVWDMALKVLDRALEVK